MSVIATEMNVIGQQSLIKLMPKAWKNWINNIVNVRK